MTELRVKIVRLDEDNNDLVYDYLPKGYLEVKEIRDLPKQHKKFIKEVYYTTYSNISYEKLVAKLVREKYNADEESAIQRKAIMNGITDEFLTYNAYVEDCKTRAKAFIAERESVLNGNK